MSDFIFNPRFEKSDDGDEPIETFGETPAPEIKKEELEDAEEQIQEDEESESEEALLRMTSDQLLQKRFIPANFDYGTPAGSDSPGGGCDSCGTEDAGDAAIIDAEIAPTEGSPSDDTADTEETFGDDTDISGDLEMYVKWTDAFNYHICGERKSSDALYIVSMESFSDLVSSLVGLMKNLMIKIAKYTRKVYKFSRNKIASTHIRLQTVHKLWNHKLNPNLGKVDMDRLGEMEIEAFPYETWVDVAKVSLIAFEIVKSAERIIFEPGDSAVTNTMEQFKSKLDSVGININVTKNRIIMDDLLDHRRFDSVLNLGYTKSQIPNCLRYFGDIAKRVPKGDENTLEGVTQHAMKRITEFAASVNKAVEEGRLQKGSEEYRQETDKLMNYTVRFDFILTCMKCSYLLFDKLSLDIQRVFGKYEDALSSPALI